MIKNGTPEESAHKKDIEGKIGLELLGFKGSLAWAKTVSLSYSASIIMKIFGFMFLSSQSNYDLFLVKLFKKDNSVLHFLLNECIHNLRINTHEQKHIYCFIYSTLHAEYGNTFPLARTATHSFLVKQTFTTKSLK